MASSWARSWLKVVAAGIQEDSERFRAPERLERGGDRLRAHDHPRSPAVRRIVDAPMPPDPPLAEVVRPDLDEAALLDPARDALGEGPLDHRRKERDDVDLEGHRGITVPV